MLKKKHITEILRAHQAELASEFGVKRIGLFDPYWKGKRRQDSDIDLVVEFNQHIGFRFIELAEHLEALLGAPVDLLTPAGIDGIRLPQVANEICETVE